MDNPDKSAWQQAFGHSFDLVLTPAWVLGREGLVVFLDGMVDRVLLEDGVLAPLAETKGELAALPAVVHSSSELQEQPDFESAQEAVAKGDVVIEVEGRWWSISLRKVDKRAITEPPTSSVIKGPREGFGEDIAQNISLLRRRVKDKSLIVERMVVGRITHTPVAVCWLDGVADPQVVDKVKARIAAIDIDGVVDSSYIGQLIEDNKGSLYEQFGSQEKPDIVTAKMLEGRVAIVVDGSPMVLTLPYLLVEGFQDGEDYYRKPKRTSFLRVVRVFAVMMALLLPAAYVALQEYHYQFFPLAFLVTVLGATAKVPFQAGMEMFVVLLLFEVLNEASVRMPKYVGMALSIVGAIVLGETAVAAGLLSSPAVLVMALSAIGLYTTPTHIGSLGIMRFAFLVAATLLGLVGLVLSFVLFVGYTVCLCNYGADFVAPLSPAFTRDWKDALAKGKLEDMTLRPYSIPNTNRRRMGDE